MERVPDEDQLQRFTRADCEAAVAATVASIGGRSKSSRSKEGRRLKELGQMIEAEIIPRLLVNYESPRPLRTEPDRSNSSGLPLASSGIVDFARIVSTGDFPLAAAYVRGMLANGELSVDALCYELLAPTARHLGELWEQDLCDFAEVTLGLWRLQQILREFVAGLPVETTRNAQGLHALLLPTPGEQHTFGLSMVMEFFRRDGWQVFGGSARSAAELRELVRDRWFDIIGFSVSSERNIKPLETFIRTVRRASLNPGIGVLVGGRLVTECPDLVKQIGADLVASDGQGAPLQAELLVAAKAKKELRQKRFVG